MPWLLIVHFSVRGRTPVLYKAQVNYKKFRAALSSFIFAAIKMQYEKELTETDRTSGIKKKAIVKK